MDWAEFFIAGALFLLTHRVPTIRSVRARFVEVFGIRGFIIGYSLLSLAMLAWLIVAAGRAPYVEVWAPAAWQAWVPNVVMPVAVLLIVFSVGAPNPLSFGSSDPSKFNPARPGVVGVARHGLLWGLALWSASHLIPNGDLAHIILFGVFFMFSIYGMRVIDRRKQRELGQARWNELAHATSFWPLQSLFMGRWRPRLSDLGRDTLLRLIIAVIAYAVLLLWLHAGVLGVEPWPVLT